ncbi:TIGR00269 family protein [archaeon]|nr:TIGR00269 family protein [archaeon]
MCKNCKTNPVFALHSGARLCSSCFLDYFERKVKKTIKAYKMLDSTDKIGIAISGGKDSLALLHILNAIALQQRSLSLHPILIDEGIKNYREHTIKDAKAYCKKNNIPLTIASFKKEFGFTLDKLTKLLKDNPCTICGIFRRHLLNKTAHKLKLSRIATGHNLDDECQSILMNYFKPNLELSARLGPITGIIRHPSFAYRIKPLYFMHEKETAAYALIKKFSGKFVECPYSKESYRSKLRDMLNNFEAQFPGTKEGIISSFLALLPLLKEKYKTAGTELKLCRHCKEPCTLEICSACKLKEKIKGSLKYAKPKLRAVHK